MAKIARLPKMFRLQTCLSVRISTAHFVGLCACVRMLYMNCFLMELFGIMSMNFMSAEMLLIE